MLFKCTSKVIGFLLLLFYKKKNYNNFFFVALLTRTAKTASVLLKELKFTLFWKAETIFVECYTKPVEICPSTLEDTQFDSEFNFCDRLSVVCPRLIFRDL